MKRKGRDLEGALDNVPGRERLVCSGVDEMKKSRLWKSRPILLSSFLGNGR